ncbi:MAG TPA: HAD family acid phosphatase [Capillimicrobium sp.]|nr:HAD family acid phosphatase [Capillimicrobium sp.]
MPRQLLAAALVALLLVATAAVALGADRDPAGPTPPKPRPFVVNYYESGEWAADVKVALTTARRQMLRELDDVPKGEKPAIVLDIDDTSLTQYPCRKPGDLPFDDPAAGAACVASGTLPPIKPTRALYRLALRRHVKVFFVTGRPEAAREVTIANLKRAGYTGRHTLILRPNDTLGEPSVVPYKSGEREEIESGGHDILVNVGDQWSDLKGGAADHRIKVANPMYFIP